MSVYTVHKLLHRAQVDLDFRERLRSDPAAVDRGLAIHRRGAQRVARR